MAAFVDNCKFNPTAGGTTDWTFASAVLGSQSPSASGAVNGAKYKFLAISADQTQWELAEGAYTSSTGVFARTTVLYNSSGNTSKINFSAAPTVAIVALLEDLIGAQDNFSVGMAGGTLVASVASNVLTVAVKTFAGNDPSASDPVLFFFRDAAAATGDYTVRLVTSALSINTSAAGATLGSTNTVPFRLWVHAFDNAGTVVLALYQSVTFSGGLPTNIAAWDETTPSTTTAIGASATSAATFYTQSAIASAKAFTPLGYLDFAGLTTAGSYTAVPAKIQLFRNGVKKPLDHVRQTAATTATADTGSTTTTLTGTFSASITPSSNVNLVEVNAWANHFQNGANGGSSRVVRGGGVGATTGTAVSNVAELNSNSIGQPAFYALDAPATASAQAYTLQRATNNAASTAICPSQNLAGQICAVIKLTEIMV